MYATNFLFDKNLASDFGLIIGSFDFENETAVGGEIKYDTIKAPNKDSYDFYGSQFDTVLVWNFSIIKNPYRTNNLYFDQYEESEIVKWLSRTDGYKWLHFIQDGYEDLYYKVQINITPHQVGGITVGYDLTATSNCGYGFSREIVREYILNAKKPIKLYINSDINDYILPRIVLNGYGDFYINNDNDLYQNICSLRATELQNIDTTVTMDSDADLITGISSPNDFNWYFLRLVNGINKITTNSNNNIKIEITYREPRRVMI